MAEATAIKAAEITKAAIVLEQLCYFNKRVWWHA